MRTTLTIDDQLLDSLKQAAQQSGRPFKQVVNEALRLGLHELKQPKARPYHLPAAKMGQPRGHGDLDRALLLADTLEDVAIASKLEMRK